MNSIALIPAFNEEQYIVDTISSIKRIDGLDKIVVIDDGSTDNTVDLALQAGVEVYRLELNGGKGHALDAGWKHFYANNYLFLDADLGESAQLAEELLIPLLHGTADMTIAHFVTGLEMTEAGGFGLAKGLASWGIRRMTGRKLESPLSGQRGVKRAVLESIGGLAEGFGIEVALTIKAIQKGFRVREIALPMTHRYTGKNLPGFLHRGRQFIAVCSSLRDCLKDQDAHD